MFRLRPDPLTLSLVATVGLATVLPVRGTAVPVAGALTQGVIALLFFLHGARLSRAALLEGLTNWRLHAVVLASTFVLFPLLGLALHGGLGGWLAPNLTLGLLYLSLLPSTVQSSIAFTSVAGGNVAAAVCSASASNLLGIVLTPVLVGLFMNPSGEGISGHAVGAIFVQLFLPFLAGHLLRPWIGAWVGRRRALLSLVDRGSIVLVVYTAFSEAVVHGLWHQLGVGELLTLMLLNALLLAAVLGLTLWGSRRLGFSREDEIAIVFCGSKKSLATGVPMAGVLFPSATVGALVLPLMLFHQLQLMVCAVLARRYAQGLPQGPGRGAAQGTSVGSGHSQAER